MEFKQTDWMKLLKQQGARVFFVGGVVRDFKMLRDNKDIDILVTGLPTDAIISIIRQFGKVDEVGKSFGIIKLKEFDTDLEFDIALPRKEVKIGDGHKGFQVIVDPEFTVLDDLERRDFTINAIAMEVIEDGGFTFIDPFKGLDDIEKGLIRCVSPKSFSDDPLRILRGLQFSARFGFEIEKETQDLMFKSISDLKHLSGERIAIELEKGLKGDIDIFTELIVKFKVFESFSQGQMKTFVKEHVHSETLGVFLFSILGFFDDGEIKFLVDGLKLPTQTVKEVEALKHFQELVSKDTPLAIAMQQSLLISDILLETEMFGDIPFGFKAPQLKHHFRTGGLPIRPKDLPVTGEEFMAMGFKGKEIGDKQKEIIEKVLLKEIDFTKEAIIEFIKK